MTNENLPLVSIVIPCHNYGRYLSESIGSALNQTYPNIEVIVIDDDSTDDTSEAAKRFPVKYFRIKHKGNATPAHAHNVGLTVCKGDFIIFFGADDRLNPLYVERCYNKFMNHKKNEPKVGFVWTGTQEFGDSNEIRLPRVDRLAHSWSAYENMGGQVGAMLVPLLVYKVVSGYDESLHGLEDWDWVIRALSKGFIGVSIKEPLHEQRFHGKNLTITTIRVNMEVELWAKYPWMKQYVFARNRFNEIKLFITENNRFRIKVYNRTVHKLFHVPSLTAGPDNCQHVWVNERRIIKKVKGRKILDCGCGKGRWGYLLGKNHAVIGVDVIRNYLEEAQSLSVYDGLVRADLAHLPFKAGSFDTVLAVEVIEHLPEEDGVSFLNQIRSLGKRQVLTTPKEFVEVNFGKDHPETHRSFWTKEQIISILAHN